MANRSKILAVFRDLHRARRQVFGGDSHALLETRTKINDEFRKNITEKDPSKVEELLVLGRDVARLLRASVVQLQERQDGVYEMKVTKDTVTIENTMFDPFADIPEKPMRKKLKSKSKDSSNSGCCS